MSITTDQEDNIIVTSGNAFSVAAGDTLIVERGIIIGGGTFAVELKGSNHLVVKGVLAAAAAISDQSGAGSIIDIETTGAVAGTAWGAVIGTGSALSNHGSISGNSVGIYAIQTGDFSITNFGLIQTGTSAFTTIYLAGGGTHTLINSGQINDGTLGPTSHAIFTGSGSEQITNTGGIVGAVSLGAGDDLLDTHTGTVQGIVDMGAGIDTVYGSAAADQVLGGTENDLIRGNAGQDILDGGDGTGDFLDYGEKTVAVRVTLNGATAVTVFVKGVAEDTVSNFEFVGGGKSGDKLVGDGLANQLFGNRGEDSLNGADGDDTLNGGLGNDTLRGGVGFDAFLFDTKIGATNVDTIFKFEHDVDKILLDNDVMKKLGAVMTDDQFYAAAGATHGHDASDRVIYNSSTGSLYYDKDGSGHHAAVKIAVLDHHPTLSYTDIIIV